MSLQSAFVIGSDLHAQWSNGYNPEGYLKVVPHSGQSVQFKSAWTEWQHDQRNYRLGDYSSTDRNGSYYSSWGPDRKLHLKLDIARADQIKIDGLGVLKANPQSNGSIYDDTFLLYNGQSAGPLLVVDPGDTVRIRLKNSLQEDIEMPYNSLTNIHFHGLHVSPLGNGDNVMITIAPGETWRTKITIPDDHYSGPFWYHPHLHGSTNYQVSNGLVGTFLVLPSPEEEPSLDNYNPVDEPIFWLPIQAWALNEEERAASPQDPLNQDQDGGSYRIGTPIEFTRNKNGGAIYTKSGAPYLGYNYMPSGYDPLDPSSYGVGVNGTPIENIIHTVNGQYNPTLKVNVGEWATFGFLNETANSTMILQLVREKKGKITLEDFRIIGLDGNISVAAADPLNDVTETPVLAAGARVTVQAAFTKPGHYYWLANGTKELLGDAAPDFANTTSAAGTYGGINDGHLVMGPQALATVEVIGEPIAEKPAPPLPWNTLAEQASATEEWIAESKVRLDNGELRERSFVWNANFQALQGAPDDNDPETFVGVYTINGALYGHTPETQGPVTLAMLGTTEVWTVSNTSIGSGVSSSWGEAHPDHIHQNEFSVLEINGIPVEDLSYYPENAMVDTVFLGGQYIAGTQSVDNPYGQAAWLESDGNGGMRPVDGATPFTTKNLMKFEDYTGTYVEHCHYLFHEDAGMMQAVRIILNTDSSFINAETSIGPVSLSLGTEPESTFTLAAFGLPRLKVNVASDDINFMADSGGSGTSDHVADIAVVQQFSSKNRRLTVKIFDGQGVKNAAGLDGAGGAPKNLNARAANSPDVLMAKITPFGGKQFKDAATSLALGDVDGDGYADIMVGVGGAGLKPRVEIYSGNDFSLMARLRPFMDSSASTAISLAAGDLNSDNFCDVLIGQGAGGDGLVEAFDGLEMTKLIQGGNGKKGDAVAAGTAMYHDAFMPFGADYSGAIDVATGLALPRPESYTEGQVVQASVADIVVLAVDQAPSDANPAIKFFYASAMGEMNDGSAHMDSDVPTFMAALNPEEGLKNLNGTFFDLSSDPNDRGMAGLVASPSSGSTSSLYYIESDSVQDPTTSIFAYQSIPL